MMRHKTVIVTGANSGIGKATAAELLRREARVIIACRSVERGDRAAQEIRQLQPDTGQLLVRPLDLACMSSVRSFCLQINKVMTHIHLLQHPQHCDLRSSSRSPAVLWFLITNFSHWVSGGKKAPAVAA